MVYILARKASHNICVRIPTRYLRFAHLMYWDLSIWHAVVSWYIITTQRSRQENVNSSRILQAVLTVMQQRYATSGGAFRKRGLRTSMCSMQIVVCKTKGQLIPPIFKKAFKNILAHANWKIFCLIRSHMLIYFYISIENPH